MANFIKFGPLLLFCALTGKFLAISGSLYDVLAIGIVGILVGVEKHYNHTDALVIYTKELKTIKDDIQSVKDKQDNLSSAVASVRVAQGFRPAVPSGNR